MNTVRRVIVQHAAEIVLPTRSDDARNQCAVAFGVGIAILTSDGDPVSSSVEASTGSVRTDIEHLHNSPLEIGMIRISPRIDDRHSLTLACRAKCIGC